MADEIIIPGAAEEPEAPAAEEKEWVKCHTAFLIYILPNGKAVADGNLNVPLDVDVECDMDTMYRSCAEVMRDISSIQASDFSAQKVLAVFQQAQQSAQGLPPVDPRERALVRKLKL